MNLMRGNEGIKCRNEEKRSGDGSEKPARLPEAAAGSTSTSTAGATTAPAGAAAYVLVEDLKPKAKAPPSHPLVRTTSCCSEMGQPKAKAPPCVQLGLTSPSRLKPAVSPAAAPQASSAGLRSQLVELLKGRDVTSMSHKTVRGELEASLSLPAGALDGQREEIMGIVADLMKDGTCTVEKQSAKQFDLTAALHEYRVQQERAIALLHGSPARSDSGISDGGYYETQYALG